jgi:hypothetical protein
MVALGKFQRGLAEALAPVVVVEVTVAQVV